MPEDIIIKPGDVRTMKKDIEYLQKTGEVPPPVIYKEGRKKEEGIRPREPKLIKQEEEKNKKEQMERMKREEKIRKQEEEDIKRKIEKFKMIEEERRKIEDRKKQEEEKVRKEGTARDRKMKLKQETEQRKAEERRKREEDLIRRAQEARIKAEQEEIKKREEIQRRKDPEQRKKFLLEEKSKIEIEKDKIKLGLNKIITEKKPFDIKKTELLKKIEEIKNSFDSITQKEKEIEQEIKNIESQELSVKTGKEKRQIEKKRWGLERQRQGLEKKRWPWDKKLQATRAEIEKIDRDCAQINIKEKELRGKQEVLDKKEKDMSLEIERIDLKKDVKAIDKFKKDLESSKNQDIKEINKLDESLKEILAKEKEIEQKKNSIEKEEAAAKDLEKRREFEQKRWQIEEERRKIESRRWILEEEKDKLEAKHKRGKQKIKDLLLEEKNKMERIKEIDKLLWTGPPRPPESFHPPRLSGQPDYTRPSEPLSEEQRRIEQAQKRIEALRKGKGKEPEKEEKKYLPLGREPISEEKIKTAPPLGVIKKKEERDQERLSVKSPALGPEKEKISPGMPSIPERPSLGEKFWIRILIFIFILIILAVVATFWYWYLVIRKQPPAPETGQPTPGYETPGPTEEKLPEIAISDSLAEKAKILDVSSPEEIPGLFEQLIEEKQEQNQFKKIIVKNPSQEKIFTSKEVFEALGINLSQNFYQKIKDNFSLYLYSQAEGNRITFISQISEKKDLSDLMDSEEPGLKNTFNSLLILIKPELSAAVPYFKNASYVRGYEGLNFRYQSLGPEDLVICYLVSDNYFVFSTSWKSMVWAIEKLKI